MKLSIIVPTIRGIKKINKIIENILSYKNPDFQLIIINDDPLNSISVNQENISSEFLFPGFNKNNLVVINNDKNYGPGLSRNIGIDRALGEYVCFVDDDDEVDLTTLANLDLKEVDADIYFMRFEDSSGSFTNGELFRVFVSKFPITVDRIIYNWNSSQKLATHCQPYIFRKEYLTKENIRFPSTYIVEDMVFNTLAIVKAKKIQLVDYNYYMYNSEFNSLKSSAGVERAIDVLSAIKHLIKGINGNKFDVIKREFIANTINFLKILFIIRISTAINQNLGCSIRLDAFEVNDIELMLDLGVKVDGIFVKRIINSDDVFASQVMTLNKIKQLGLDNQSNIYLYCCGQICEYFRKMIAENIKSQIFIVDDKAGLIDNNFLTLDTILIDKSKKNYFILCNQQKWINIKIEHKLISKFQNQNMSVIHAIELLG